MYPRKQARGAGFEVTMPDECPSSEPSAKRNQSGEFYRPDESDRAARARQWIRQARGLPPDEEKQTA
jgi:hypothetical protein